LRTKEGIKAASATYKKTTNELSKCLQINVKRTKYPSDDFQEMLELIPEHLEKQFIKWYEIGIKRGFKKATDLMLDDFFYLDKKTLFCKKDSIVVRVKTKFKGKKWVKRKFEIKAKDIGFE